VQGVLDHCTDAECAAVQRGLVQARCEELLVAGADSPYLLGFMVELVQRRLATGQDPPEAARLVAEAETLCGRLATDLDTIRARYWRFTSDTIVKKFGVAD
jgi:molybdopterin-guanine dinucleotide biosynthesis protein A